MARSRSAQNADLQRVYDQIPVVRCRGLCQHSCGPIGMSPREHQRLDGAVPALLRVQRHQVLEATNGQWRCPALTETGLCSVYELRPTVCRLWGAMEGLECPHGCKVKPRLLDVATGMRLAAEANNAGGGLYMDPEKIAHLASLAPDMVIEMLR